MVGQYLDSSKKSLNSDEVIEIIGKVYSETGDYTEMYRQHARLADFIWLNKARKDYAADLWYNKNRNTICLEMLGDMCWGKRVLSVGGRLWIERDFVKALDGANVIRTDIIGDPDEGVIEADATSLPFEDGIFDVVLCRELVEHVPDAQPLYDEIRRVLVPDGYLLITTPNAFTLSLDGTMHVRAYSPIGFIKELNSQGFKVIKKRGNIPYILNGLMALAGKGFEVALEDAMEIDRLTRHLEERYYLSTQLFALCQKGGNE